MIPKFNEKKKVIIRAQSNLRSSSQVKLNTPKSYLKKQFEFTKPLQAGVSLGQSENKEQSGNLV
jgi:hypothetical protein